MISLDCPGYSSGIRRLSASATHGMIWSPCGMFRQSKPEADMRAVIASELGHGPPTLLMMRDVAAVGEAGRDGIGAVDFGQSNIHYQEDEDYPPWNPNARRVLMKPSQGLPPSTCWWIGLGGKMNSGSFSHVFVENLQPETVNVSPSECQVDEHVKTYPSTSRLHPVLGA
jgi:hypothetical protein